MWPKLSPMTSWDFNVWKPVKKIIEDQNGAVTVDWVVLTAVTLGLGTATYLSMENSVDSLTGEFSTKMVNKDVSTDG